MTPREIYDAINDAVGGRDYFQEGVYSLERAVWAALHRHRPAEHESAGEVHVVCMECKADCTYDCDGCEYPIPPLYPCPTVLDIANILYPNGLPWEGK